VTEFISKSGAKIVINPAPWKDAKQLKKAVERELAAGGMNDLFKVALLLDSSDVVEAALMPCLIRCTRNDIKITDSTFDDVDARQDYHEIAVECWRVNNGPLVESLSSQLEKMGFLTKKSPENIPS
jgi:hypothetical protein